MRKRVLADFTFNGVTELSATVPDGKTWEVQMFQVNNLSASDKTSITIKLNSIMKVNTREIIEAQNIDVPYTYILEEGEKVTITSSTDTGILNVDIIGLEIDA